MKSKTIVKNRIIDIDYEKNKISWFYYMPLLLIAGFVPLIVYGKYVNLNGTTQALFWTGQNELLDFFSYWKSRWVISLTAVALVIYIFLFSTKKLPFKREYKYYIPLATYVFFVILSTIFAIDVPTALNGFVDMYQGMWVLLSYVTITFLVINFANSERDIKLFLYAFIFLIIVEGLIGIGQYFGFDIFNTKLGNYLIIPSGVKIDGGLTFNFGKHTIYGTLFNTNFVGSFAALMLPMAVVFLIIAKTAKKRIVAAVALILCLFTWIGCNSRAGYLGVAVSAVFAIWMFRAVIKKHWKISLILLFILIIILFGLNFASNGKIFNRLKTFNINKEIEEIKNLDKSSDKFEEIILKNNTFSVKTNKEILNFKIEGEKLFFKDENNIDLPIKTYGNEIIIDDPRYLNYVIVINNESPIIEVKRWTRFDLMKISFYISENGEIKIVGNGGRIIEPKMADRFINLDGLESLMSGRVYIWNRSIPLLVNNLIIGSGADNYIYGFPQDDVVSKLNVGMHANFVIDKPHNMFLQIAVNTGLVSLIALIIVWGIYIISSIKLYWKLSLDSTYKYIGIACFLSVVGYLFAGIFNDYIVSVSPIFWCILGLGISINAKLKAKEDSNV